MQQRLGGDGLEENGCRFVLAGLNRGWDQMWERGWDERLESRWSGAGSPLRYLPSWWL